MKPKLGTFLPQDKQFIKELKELRELQSTKVKKQRQKFSEFFPLTFFHFWAGRPGTYFRLHAKFSWKQSAVNIDIIELKFFFYLEALRTLDEEFSICETQIYHRTFFVDV